MRTVAFWLVAAAIVIAGSMIVDADTVGPTQSVDAVPTGACYTELVHIVSGMDPANEGEHWCCNLSTNTWGACDIGSPGPTGPTGPIGTDTGPIPDCTPGASTYQSSDAACNILDGLEDFENSNDDGLCVGDGGGFTTRLLTDCQVGGLAYSTASNTFGCNEIPSVPVNAGRVPFADGSNDFTSDADFTFAADVLTVDDIILKGDGATIGAGADIDLTPITIDRSTADYDLIFWDDDFDWRDQTKGATYNRAPYAVQNATLIKYLQSDDSAPVYTLGLAPALTVMGDPKPAFQDIRSSGILLHPGNKECDASPWAQCASDDDCAGDCIFNMRCRDSTTTRCTTPGMNDAVNCTGADKLCMYWPPGWLIQASEAQGGNLVFRRYANTGNSEIAFLVDADLTDGTTFFNPITLSNGLCLNGQMSGVLTTRCIAKVDGSDNIEYGESGVVMETLDDWLPDTDDAHDLGTASKQWQHVFISDTLKLSSNATPPVACGGGELGRIYVDSTANELCWCDGTSYKNVTTGAGCS